MEDARRCDYELAHQIFDRESLYGRVCADLLSRGLVDAAKQAARTARLCSEVWLLAIGQ